MKRVVKTSFPGKYIERGTQHYIAVPVNAVERMGLKNGDHLDVCIRIPETDEVEIELPKRGKKNTEENDE